MPGGLPSSVRVIVRGFLNCNQVVLRAPRANVLIDSGYCTHGERTLQLVAGAGGLAGEGLDRLINTHCHTDHMGGNAALSRAYGCRITIPEGEAKNVRPWSLDIGSTAHFDHRSEPFDYDDTLRPGDLFEAGGLEWEAHAAPGHDMEALVFFERRHRILVSGDALWENGLGIVWPAVGAQPRIEAALETIARIEELDPAVVIPGHGEPFEDVAGAIARGRSRLAAFLADPAKNARHVLKVLFAFALLDRGSMEVAHVADYLARIRCYGELSGPFLGLQPRELADWLLPELERAGAIRIEGGIASPTMAA